MAVVPETCKYTKMSCTYAALGASAFSRGTDAPRGNIESKMAAYISRVE